MKLYSRTEYSVKNAYIITISRLAAILMGFTTRVVFTHSLSESYVGVNGLFTDILKVLSLSELGIETAIAYALYRPIAENNIEEQKSLMHLYRLCYRAVAIVLTLSGLLFIPFMGIFVKSSAGIDHLLLIYLLYLSNSAFSYLLIYKKTLIDAHQMSYIGFSYQAGFWVLQDIIQIIILVTTKNYILFLIVFNLCTVGSNICISKKAEQLYPYLREKEVKRLGKEKRRELFDNIKAMFLHRIGTVAVNNTDNLLLATFIGIVSAGIYSNYFLVIQSINQIFYQMFEGITASIGNLGVEKDSKNMKKVFESAFFLSHWIYGFGAICLYELLNPFIHLCFGSNYLFSEDIVLIFCINFLLIGIKDATMVFRNSLGLFRQDRYISILGAITNLIISILLVKQFGVIGVFAGTLISHLMTSAWMEPYLFYKYYLKVPFLAYLYRYFRYLFSIGLSWISTDYVCRFVKGSTIIIILVRLILCLLIPNLIILIINFKNKEFNFTYEKVYSVLKKRGKK